MAYPKSDPEAAALYQKFKDKDPFPEIPAALLNSADIADYVSATGMISPFYETNLTKPASYGIALRGRCIYWDGKGKKCDFILSDKEIPEYKGMKYRKELVLTKNSIAFVTLEPIIRLPEYIAVRFNLTIQDVYRGLLLGSGPIVDPGFQGRLSFPLHNLTNNDYTYRAGDEMVWMEFSKLSPHSKWLLEPPAEIKREGVYRPFPGHKLLRKDVSGYLQHAFGDQTIRSSIPIEIQETAKSIRAIKWTTYIAFGAVFASLIAAVIAGWSLVAQVQSSIIGISDDIKLQKVGPLLSEVKMLSAEIESLKAKVDALNSELAKRPSNSNPPSGKKSGE